MIKLYKREGRISLKVNTIQKLSEDIESSTLSEEARTQQYYDECMAEYENCTTNYNKEMIAAESKKNTKDAEYPLKKAAIHQKSEIPYKKK